MSTQVDALPLTVPQLFARLGLPIPPDMRHLREPLPLVETLHTLSTAADYDEQRRLDGRLPDEMRPNRADSLRAQVVVDFVHIGPRRTLVTTYKSRRVAMGNFIDRRQMVARWNARGWRDCSWSVRWPDERASVQATAAANMPAGAGVSVDSDGRVRVAGIGDRVIGIAVAYDAATGTATIQLG